MKRSSMGKEMMSGKRKGPPPKKGPMAQGMMESPRKKMASGMTPIAPMAMKKGGMAKKPKMAKGGMMLIIGVGKKPSMKKGK